MLNTKKLLTKLLNLFPIVEWVGDTNIPLTSSWTLPSSKPYDRIMVAQPYWGTYNSTAMSTMVVNIPANATTLSTTNWSKNVGGVEASGNISANICFIRIV